MIVANHEPMYWVARLSSAAGSSQAPFLDRRLPEADRDRVRHDHVEQRGGAHGADQRPWDRLGRAWLSSPSRGRLEAHEQQDAEHHAVEDGVTDVVEGLKTASVLLAWKMIATARISIGVNESAANVSIAPIAIRTPM